MTPEHASPEHASPERASLERAVAGQYAVERELGRGGMGVVYLARDLRLDRRVAIKVLPSALAAQPAVRERFLREARIAAQLAHPNIVPVHRADEIDGVAFFVMGFVDGESLGERMRRAGPLDAQQTAALLAEVARALAYAHARGIVHRDVKPENILVERETGRPMVTDFGVARLAEASPLTSVGLVLGTVHYMSPEQAASDAVDGRSDLYSLGVVAYHAMSGALPFDGPTAAAVIIALATRPAPPLASVAPRVPRAIAAVVDRCLAKRAEDRYESGEALGAALERAAAESTGLAPGAPPPATRPSSGERIVSEDDAAWLWRRAAELQATARDGPEIGERAAAPRAPTPPAATPHEGYRMRDVTAAAADAGISRQYVALALDELRAERGGITTSPPPKLPTTVDERSERSIVTGGPTTIELETVVAGEVPASAYEEIVDTIRRSLGEMGQVSTLGHSLAWSIERRDRAVHVTIVPRGGRTSIRVSERLGHLTGEIFGGVMGGVGGGLGGVSVGVLMGTLHSAPIAFGTWGAVIVGAYGLARGIFAFASERREKKLRELLGELTEQVEEAIGGSAEG